MVEFQQPMPMNGLDKRIAELKGWAFKRNDRGSPIIISPVIQGKELDLPLLAEWSTSDAKALELVDELVGPGSAGDFAFALHCSPSGIMWYADFARVTKGYEVPRPGIWKGEGISRPEAICRAYIAAREWMATKGGA